MARKHLKDKRQLGTYLPLALYSALIEYSELTGIPITRIVEDALRDYLELPK